MVDVWGPTWHKAQSRLGLVRHDPAGYTASADPAEPYNSGPRPRWSVTEEEGQRLAELATGAVVYEIGTGLGVSTRWLASTAALVITCDIDPWVQRDVWADLAPLPNVLLCGNQDALPVLPGRRVVFIDGCHEEPKVSDDMRTALRLADGDGLIILHDYKAVSVRNGSTVAGLTALVVETHNGLGVMRVQGET